MESVEQHKQYQHMPYGCLKRRRNKGGEAIFEEIIAKHFQNLGETMNLHIQQV